MTTAAATTTTVQALHPGFASVTQSQVEAIWGEVVIRSGSTRWGSDLATAYTLMAAHLLALAPSGATGSGVGLTAGSSRSSQLSITRRLAAADPRNGDLDQTVWGERWLALVNAKPTLSAPAILF